MYRGAYDRLDDLWKSLKPIFEKMFRMETLSKAEHTAVNNYVYGYCITTDSHDSSKVIGLDLYKKLRQFFREYVSGLRTKAERLEGSELLSFFESNWQNYAASAKYIDHRCNYLNRNWVKTKVDEGVKDVVIIYSLALMIWKDELFKPCSRSLMAAVFEQITRERRGESILVTRLNTIINSLVELCLSGETNAQQSCQPSVQAPATSISANPSNLVVPQSLENSASIPIYRDYFEQPFLSETSRYYESESKHYIESHSVTEYLEWYETRLAEERKRAAAYLHSTTLVELVKATEESLIGNHIFAISREFVNLLKDGRIEDLRRMFRALTRFDEGESTLVQMMESYVEEIGTSAVRQVAEDAKTNPRVFVDAIVKVQRECDSLLVKAFENNPSFSRAIGKGCERFINRNAITDNGNCTRKTPELLAKYTDMLLKKGSKEVQLDDLEPTLSAVMNVFKYVEDKDVFQKFYSNTLARRLVHNLSISDAAETMMISFLKGACGVEYTSKLQRMFQDISGSREVSNQFNAWLGKQKNPETGQPLIPIELSVMVLSSNAWPFQGQAPINFPPDLEKCFSIFTQFYQGEHEGRKLAWCYQLCRCEVVSLFTKSRYTFQVSALQVAVLMLYNTSDVYTVEQIQSQTNIEMPTLQQILQIFLKGRVLKLASGEADDQSKAQPTTGEEELKPQTQVFLYKNYNNKRVRVNLNLPLKSESKQESETTNANVDCDRKLGIQACIVRIMKARKTLEHHQLVKEVIDQMASHFAPAVSQIKMSINSLIERDFIKRSSESLSIYEYVA